MDMPKTEVPVDTDIMELVPFFLKSRDEDIKKLNGLFSENNYSEMAKISHTIKGIARPYGFPSLELFAKELEGACKRSETSTIQHQIVLIEQYLRNYSID